MSPKQLAGQTFKLGQVFYVVADNQPENKTKKEKSNDEVLPRPNRLGLGAVPKMERFKPDFAFPLDKVMDLTFSSSVEMN